MLGGLTNSRLVWRLHIWGLTNCTFYHQSVVKITLVLFGDFVWLLKWQKSHFTSRHPWSTFLSQLKAWNVFAVEVKKSVKREARESAKLSSWLRKQSSLSENALSTPAIFAFGVEKSHMSSLITRSHFVHSASALQKSWIFNYLMGKNIMKMPHCAAIYKAAKSLGHAVSSAMPLPKERSRSSLCVKASFCGEQLVFANKSVDRLRLRPYFREKRRKVRRHSKSSSSQRRRARRRLFGPLQRVEDSTLLPTSWGPNIIKDLS